MMILDSGLLFGQPCICPAACVTLNIKYAAYKPIGLSSSP